MATIAAMAFVLGDRPVRPLTADDVTRMVDAGILLEDERVELLHGLLWTKAMKSPEHVRLATLLLRRLVEGTRAEVRAEAPLIVPDRTSLPEPDIAVVE